MIAKEGAMISVASSGPPVLRIHEIFGVYPDPRIHASG